MAKTERCISQRCGSWSYERASARARCKRAVLAAGGHESGQAGLRRGAGRVAAPPRAGGDAAQPAGRTGRALVRPSGRSPLRRRDRRTGGAMRSLLRQITGVRDLPDRLSPHPDPRAPRRRLCDCRGSGRIPRRARRRTRAPLDRSLEPGRGARQASRPGETARPKDDGDPGVRGALGQGRLRVPAVS
jgi:hypothetical protein